MKLSKSLVIVGSTNATMSPSQASLTEIKHRACPAVTPNALFDGAMFVACVSDMDCEAHPDHQIFNHFDTTGEEMALVPECRSILSSTKAGFTCGTDPTLRVGTRVVVPNIPETGYDPDDRKITIIRKGNYEQLVHALAGQAACPNHSTDPTCPNIEFFDHGCPSTKIENGLVIFENPFNQANCMPHVTDHEEDGSWVEEHQIYIGYNDLIHTIPGGLDTKVDIHKVYEVSCKINKMGEVGTDVETVLLTNNEDVEDSIDTNFYIEKFFGDITDASTRVQLTETDVIPFSPNADPNDRFQFKIWSDHEKEYVHLETCKLTLDGDDAFEQEFINDGCVTDDWKAYFANEYRTQKINEDWFNMRPLLINCKSKWHIDCTVASCKRGLESTNYGAYEQFCQADDKCAARYTTAFMDTNARKRRSVDDGAVDPAEDHVELDLVHPCYYVDEQNSEYCVDSDTCWSLEQCTAAFPDDYSNSELDDLMGEFKKALQDHIDELLTSTESPIIAHEQIMENIRDNASRVMEAKQTFDDAVEAIIQSINDL